MSARREDPLDEIVLRVWRPGAAFSLLTSLILLAGAGAVAWPLPDMVQGNLLDHGFFDVVGRALFGGILALFWLYLALPILIDLATGRRLAVLDRTGLTLRSGWLGLSTFRIGWDDVTEIVPARGHHRPGFALSAFLPTFTDIRFTQAARAASVVRGRGRNRASGPREGCVSIPGYADLAGLQLEHQLTRFHERLGQPRPRRRGKPRVFAFLPRFHTRVDPLRFPTATVQRTQTSDLPPGNPQEQSREGPTAPPHGGRPG